LSTEKFLKAKPAPVRQQSVFVYPEFGIW